MVELLWMSTVSLPSTDADKGSEGMGHLHTSQDNLQISAVTPLSVDHVELVMINVSAIVSFFVILYIYIYIYMYICIYMHIIATVLLLPLFLFYCS